MSEPVIRRAVPSDAEALARISERTFTETFGHLYPPRDLRSYVQTAYSVEKTRESLGDASSANWLVERDGDAVGFALAGPCALPHADVTAACGELKRIYVLKSLQGGGVGSRLLDETLAWLEKDGPRRLWIGVWSENYGAQRLYGRHGFTKVGEYEFEVGETRDREFILRRG
jgi:ribosomal protein S18 acetylase RimI-like enzyme